MSDNTTDFFNAPELYLLAAAFEGEVLLGLPEKEIYQLLGEEVFEEANNRLIAKGILTKEGRLTKGGALIIKALESYHQSRKYVRINNLMFAFFEEEHKDELVMLSEIEKGEKYKLFIIAKSKVLKLLIDHFPIIGREPDEAEKEFRKHTLTHQERHEVDAYQPDHIMNMEVFDGSLILKSESTRDTHQQWLVFEREEKLIMVETQEKKYYHASQYFFMKMLFDELEFPYQEVK